MTRKRRGRKALIRCRLCRRSLSSIKSRRVRLCSSCYDTVLKRRREAGESARAIAGSLDVSVSQAYRILNPRQYAASREAHRRRVRAQQMLREIEEDRKLREKSLSYVI